MLLDLGTATMCTVGLLDQRKKLVFFEIFINQLIYRIHNMMDNLIIDLKNAKIVFLLIQSFKQN